MKIHYLIFIYFYISFMLIAFNICYSFYSRRSKNRETKRIDKLLSLINYSGMPNTNNSMQFAKLMANSQYLLTFNKLYNDVKYHDDLNNYIINNYHLLLEVVRITNNKNTTYKAFYSYTLSTFSFPDSLKKELHGLIHSILYNIKDKSIFLRENTLKAIMTLGTTEDIISTLNFYNDTPEFHSIKLLTDYFLKYPSNQFEFANKVFENLDTYNTTIIIAYIDYIRLCKSDTIKQEKYYQKLHDMLLDSKTDKEVKLAILRYFRKYHYYPIYPLLVSFIEQESTIDWEYAAISALTISEYPSNNTIEVLRKASSSSNWYVRQNASKGLVTLTDNHHLLSIEMDDRYAKEMIDYQILVNQLKEGSH